MAVPACGSGTTSNPPSGTVQPTVQAPTSVASTTALSVVDRAKQDALASYRGMWQDFVSAGTTSDWQSPKLGEHATGIALTNLTHGLRTDSDSGLVTKGQPILNPTVSSVDPSDNPSKIVVSDCGDSSQWLKYRADNGQLADTPGGRRLINAIVERQVDGVWRVSDFGVHDLGTC
ncbi:hypothetical protein [Actinocrispum wychmicini]|uniref:Mce-associated membrane protein n=1 Tax=Actinocrispum wychmicini TaxID=1213861 RepID=A0A4R2JTG1_9PSEU|nr:hypothetical protein [Actinocrispum wychmicini]TCO62924.1 hypothetical protein EV192_1021064 [Actinocrispum wychmicini]